MRTNCKSIIIAAALTLCSAFSSFAEGFLGIDGEEATSVGIYIKEIQTGKVLVDHNAQMALTPASVMKAVTTASVLSVYGDNRRFATPVVLRGQKGSGATWQGDLVVKSCADPTLESENFRSRMGFCDSIVANLKRMGIKSIQGKIVVEQTLKNAGPIPQWEIEDIAWPYGAALFGFNYLDNTFTIWPATKKTKPEVPGLDVTVRKVATGNDLIRGVYSNHLVIDARDPHKKDWALKTTMPDPAAVFVTALKSQLADAGIQVAGKEKAVPADSHDKALYTHRSATYGEIMRSLMVRSDNLFAEGMLRTLSPTDSRKTAINREKDLWATRGINTRYT
ncbi:MAG: D-alanyl-D-alanine carboxypeptidase, partial [Muribaculaceae bacterium]|nr:D-alanyl-D-alanine carboxypeptidase [Muribaculaceae bacterium]